MIFRCLVIYQTSKNHCILLFPNFNWRVGVKLGWRRHNTMFVEDYRCLLVSTRLEFRYYVSDTVMFISLPALSFISDSIYRCQYESRQVTGISGYITIICETLGMYVLLLLLLLYRCFTSTVNI